MPARKNRPDKYGSERRSPPQLDATVRLLVEKLIKYERENPLYDHYVGWPDMSAAERLVKYGYLREGGRATGCFLVTEAFRHDFMES